MEKYSLLQHISIAAYYYIQAQLHKAAQDFNMHQNVSSHPKITHFHNNDVVINNPNYSAVVSQTHSIF
jgi:hypothetical protein